jgi:hypothetical protein
LPRLSEGATHPELLVLHRRKPGAVNYRPCRSNSKEPLNGYSRDFLPGGVDLRVDFEAPLRVSNLVQTTAVKGRTLRRR